MLKSFFRRVAVALCSGYIIVYYGELMFWATPDREGMGWGGIFAAWLLYSLMAYPFLCVVGHFKVHGPAAVFLAGAFYGWFEEGIILQTTYGSPDTPFPQSISFTALAWHAPIDIWAGWYLLRRVLAQNRPRLTAALAAGLGLFYGLWAVFWWNEPPPPMKALLEAGQKDLLLVRFVLFAFGTTAVLILAHWLYRRVQPAEFTPSKREMGILGVIVLLYFAFVTVPAAPKALWVLPPLMALTFWGLNRNRLAETRPNAVVAFPERIRPANYLCLFVIPLVAGGVYFLALANDLRLSTNLVFFRVATPLGVLAWLTSVVLCGRSEAAPGVCQDR